MRPDTTPHYELCGVCLLCARMCAYTQTQTYTHTRMYVQTQSYTDAHTDKTDAHTCRQTHMHTDTDAHTFI